MCVSMGVLLNYLSVALVGDSFDLDLLSSHGCVKCVCV